MKQVKKIAALLVAATMALTSASAFAENVIFEDGFETTSWGDTGFLVNPPQVKVYGENIMKDGDFENGSDIGRYSGHQIAWGVNSVGNANTYLLKTQEQKHNGNWALKIEPLAGSSWTSNNYPMVTVKEGEINGGKYDFTEGIYELEAWLYTEAPGYVVRSTEHHNHKKYLNQNGNIMGQVELNPGEWKKIVQTFSVADIENISDMAFVFQIPKGWSSKGDGAFYPLYIDDVKIRRVENAKPIDNTALDNGTTVPSNQNGIAEYTMEGIISTDDEIKNIEVIVPVNNVNGEDDYEVSLISALYDAEGKLISIPGYKEETVYAGTENYEITSTFTLPNETPSDAKLINYLWNDYDNMKAYMRQYEYPYHPYKLAVDSKTNTLNYNPYKNIPNTQWKSAPYYTGYASHSHTATAFDQISVGNAHSGLNCLYIPLPKTWGADNGVYSRGWVYRDMELEEGHTYKATFYTMCDQDFLAANVYPAGGASLTSINFAALTLDTTECSDIMKVGGGRLYESLYSWTPVTIKFTASKSGTHCLAFTQGQNGYMDKGIDKKGMGAYLDDIKVIDITE